MYAVLLSARIGTEDYALSKVAQATTAVSVTGLQVLTDGQLASSSWGPMTRH
jgi:hypothetical protein